MSTPTTDAADGGRPARRDPLPHDQRRARRPQTSSPLRRSREARVFGGVCGGIAAFVDAPPAAVRWVWALSVLPSLGVTALGYLLVWGLLPAEAPA